MPAWSYPFVLDVAAAKPIFLQIARTIAADIRRGRLKPGQRLPGSRTLALALGVHRNTVLTAYQELLAQGWIAARQAAGTFVSLDIPAGLPDIGPELPWADQLAAPRNGDEQRPAAGGPGFDLPAAEPLEAFYQCHFNVGAPPRGTLVLASGMPDLRLLPLDALAQAYRRALRVHGKTLLDYGDPQGERPLREALATMLSATRGLAATSENVLVTRGSQMALDLLGRALLAPGDVVAVEELGYRPAWQAFELSGARLAPVPVDAAGMAIDALERLIRQQRVRAVYLTPHHQYPTTATLTPARRLKLLDLARRHRIAIIEDDYDHEFHYDGQPVLPLAATDTAGVVVYVGTLSKILAPGLRLGFVHAPLPLVGRMTAIRALCDRQGDRVVERAVADLLTGGELQRHSRQMARAYRARRDAIVSALRDRLGDRVRLAVPAGGMGLWLEAPGVDVERWVQRSAARGAVFYPASRFAFDGRPRQSARLGFAPLDEAELEEAVRRIAEALPARTVHGSRSEDDKTIATLESAPAGMQNPPPGNGVLGLH